MAEVIVRIKRDPKDRKRCIMVPDPFGAQPDDTVKFVHDSDLPRPTVAFQDGALFDTASFFSGHPAQKIKKKGKFKYVVTWPEPDGDGVGNGTGEVPPG
jgi:hypothetical protein